MALVNERRLIGAFVYFIPYGKTVDGSVVSATSWPDNDPETNYGNYQFGCIERAQAFRERTTETFDCPAVTGGYDQEEEVRTIRRGYDMTTNKYNALIDQLQWELAAEPAAGVAQAPFAVTDSFIRGVVLIQGRNKTGVDAHTEQWQAKLRLVTIPDFANETGKPVLRFEFERNDLNTFEIPAP